MKSKSPKSGPRQALSRCRLIFVLLALGPCLCLTGCDGPATTMAAVTVNQPIAFPHKTHADYFASGKHRQEKIQMHVTLLGLDEVPEELRQGECTACHDDLAERKACARCHVLFQSATLRARKDIRNCIACHRQAWTGYAATIPSAGVCRSCHGDKPLTDSTEERRLQAYLVRGEDIPWIQVTTMDPHVHFSHKAHIRYGGVLCTRCHEDMAEKTSPPTAAPVFSMKECMGCHEQSRASNDCLTCHK